MKHRPQVLSPYASAFLPATMGCLPAAEAKARRACTSVANVPKGQVHWVQHAQGSSQIRKGRLARAFFLLLQHLPWHLFHAARADEALVRAVAETNVNQQYLIESVSISGVEVTRFHDAKLSPSLRKRLASLVGAPCDMSAIGDLAGFRLRSTLHLEDVHERLLRGSSPDPGAGGF